MDSPQSSHPSSPYFPNPQTSPPSSPSQSTSNPPAHISLIHELNKLLTQRHSNTIPSEYTHTFPNVSASTFTELTNLLDGHPTEFTKLLDGPSSALHYGRYRLVYSASTLVLTILMPGCKHEAFLSSLRAYIDRKLTRIVFESNEAKAVAKAERRAKKNGLDRKDTKRLIRRAKRKARRDTAGTTSGMRKLGLSFGGSSRIEFEGGSCIEPDEQIVDDTSGLPIVVFEVAVSQSYHAMKRVLQDAIVNSKGAVRLGVGFNFSQSTKKVSAVAYKATTLDDSDLEMVASENETESGSIDGSVQEHGAEIVQEAEVVSKNGGIQNGSFRLPLCAFIEDLSKVKLKDGQTSLKLSFRKIANMANDAAHRDRNKKKLGNARFKSKTDGREKKIVWKAK